MDAVKKPRGLVRYDSEQGIGQQKSRLWRPRIILYALLLGILTSSFGYLLVSRTDTETSILRARGQAPQLMPDGQTRNLFMVKSINKTFQDIPVVFQLVSKTGSLDMIGHSLIIPPQGYREGAFFIYFPSESAPLGKTSQSIPITIEVRSGDQILERVHTQFQF